MTRSEAIRRAMELFLDIHRSKGKTITSQMRGLVRSKLFLEELEEAYMMSRL